MNYKCLKLTLIFVLFCGMGNLLVAQKTKSFYNVKNDVKELMIREYFADSIDGEFVKKGMNAYRLFNDPSSAIILFDRKGNVTDEYSLICEDEYEKWKSYEFYKDLCHESVYNRSGLVREIVKRFDKHGNVIEKMFCEGDTDSIKIHETFQYNDKGHLVKKMGFDHNLGIVALSEVVGYDSLNHTYEEVVIDCSPSSTEKRIKGTVVSDHIIYRNNLYTQFRKYHSNGQIEFEYRENSNKRRIYDEGGNFLTHTILQNDLEGVRFKTEYRYYDNGLLKEEVNTKEGKVRYRYSYSYEYNERGDWKVMYKRGPKHRIVEREFIYY